MRATWKQKRPALIMTNAEQRVANRKYYLKNGVHIRARTGAYHRTHREQLLPGIRERQKCLYDKLRDEVIRAYGSECACCGDAHREFMSIDHINGGGRAHRQSIGKSGGSFYRWLKERGFPKDEFQLLCHNCNQAKGFYGACPHKEETR